MAGSGVADLAGRLLADRYRLHTPIGTGASGRVYAAEDTRLRRRVALKVLHTALADDSAFLRRFRAEAQLAASLNHPHIVTVYDWGEDDVPFLVLELLEGGSLRGMLDEGYKLSPAQAARVGRDVASALEYAHARGIVHRDIKPANLLFDEHGIVRVADFGLARALAEASWTEPAGAMLGTARYASPEQAMGVQLDARSDLYSLGLVIVEAVTGRLPFASDTPIGTLAARTQRPLIAPPELGPLAPIIERAGHIDPDERYPDAATMRAALSDAADALPRPAPLTLVGMQDRADPHPTMAQTQPTARLFDQDQSSGEVAVIDEPPTVRERRREKRAHSSDARRLVPFVVAAALVLVIALVGVALANTGGSSVAAPGLVGRSQAAAMTLAKHQGLKATVADRRPASDPAGTVISQDPAAGKWLHSGGTVRLVVSTGPPLVSIPTANGKQYAGVVKQLTALGFVVHVAPQFDPTNPAGVVLSTSPPAGTSLRPESTVKVTISKGPAPVPVPDVQGLSYSAAAAQLTNLRLKPQQAHEFSNDVPNGEVTRTTPPIGQTVPVNTTVTVYVSKGPHLVSVPDLFRMTIEAASNLLEQFGLQANPLNYKPGHKVMEQHPDSGTRVLFGSTVTLRLK